MATFGAFEEVSQAAHLSLGIFKGVMRIFVVLGSLDNRKDVLERPVVVLVEEFPWEMEPVMIEKKLENRKVKIQSVAPNLEAVVLAHLKILKAEALEFSDTFGRIIRASERFDKFILVLLCPPVHS